MAISNDAREPSLPPGLLDDWVAAGLIDRSQAANIREYEASRPGTVPRPVPAPAARGSLVIEALGYVGGIILLVGTLLIASLYWNELDTWVRLSLVGAAAVALVLAGAAVPDRLGDSGGRLRSALWLLAVAAVGDFAQVLAGDVLGWTEAKRTLLVGCSAAAVALPLWWWRRAWPQQLALLTSLITVAGSAAILVSSEDQLAAGLAVWAVSLVWLALDWSDRLAPRTSGIAFGAVGLLVGGLMTQISDAGGPNDAGIVLSLVTSAGLVALALYSRDLLLLGLAGLGILQSVPTAVGEWFPGRLGVPLALMGTGALLIAAAVYVARHRSAAPDRVRPDGAAQDDAGSASGAGSVSGGRPAG